MISIRPATTSDIAFIATVYNEAIQSSNATFDTEPRTEEVMFKWFQAHDEKHPIILAEYNGVLAGWASLNLWSDKKAYDTTAEVSVYVDRNHRKKGIGKRLIEIITLEGEKVGMHSLLARITQGNEVSMHLFESFGYVHFGTMKEAGMKFEKYWDVYFLQKIFTKA